jgi:hypothetical protein
MGGGSPGDRTYRTLALTAALTLAACPARSGDDAPGRGATVPDGTTGPTTTAPDPYAIPADPSQITPEYLNRVLEALNRVYGDVQRNVIANGELSVEDIEKLRTIFAEPLLSTQLRFFADLPHGDLQAFRTPVGDRRISSRAILEASANCVFTEAEIDLGEVLVAPGEPLQVFLGLQPRRVSGPTAWVLFFEDAIKENPCGA